MEKSSHQISVVILKSNTPLKNRHQEMPSYEAELLGCNALQYVLEGAKQIVDDEKDVHVLDLSDTIGRDQLIKELEKKEGYVLFVPANAPFFYYFKNDLMERIHTKMLKDFAGLAPFALTHETVSEDSLVLEMVNGQAAGVFEEPDKNKMATLYMDSLKTNLEEGQEKIMYYVSMSIMYLKTEHIDYLRSIKCCPVEIVNFLKRDGLSVYTPLFAVEFAPTVYDVESLQSNIRAIRVEIEDRHTLNGVVFENPNTVHIDFPVVIAPGVIIENGVTLKGRTTILPDANIKAHSVIDNSTIGERCIIGPFAHIHHQSIVKQDTVIGNYVEVTRSIIANNTKIKHLTYIGDAIIGEHVNIGAGVVFANYDGVKKHQTKIGNHVFIGSNSTLIAPLEIEDRVLIAASSVVTRDCKAGELVITRAEEKHTANGASKYFQHKRDKN